MIRVTLLRHWPLIISVGFLLAIIAVLLNASLIYTHGHLVYALDDPYIHMAMAKNFAQHGVWGVTKYEFSSSSSSLLYPLLLFVIFFLFGVNEAVPLVLNVVFATLTTYLIYILLKQYKFPSIYNFIVLLSIIFFTPFPAIIFTGMEHMLHTLITIFFAYLSAKILSKERSDLNKEFSLLLILAPFLPMTRYEGLFLVMAVSTLFIMRKRLFESFLLISLSLVPIVIYGLISISNGWYFFPNSILIKNNIPVISSVGIWNFIYLFITRISESHILILIFTASILFILKFIRSNTLWREQTILLFIFITTAFLHMLFAKTGWFYRYEAYLIAFGIFTIALEVREYLPEKLLFDKYLIPKYIAIILLIFLFISPFAIRGYVSSIITPLATKNIYEQQYQMALFLKEFYQGETVAANDIGTINFIADIKCLDLKGLGSLEVAKAKRESSYNTEYIYKLAKNEDVKIAIVYDHWFESYGGLPPQWIKVGEWKISNNVVCGGDTVSFYAVDPEEEDRLIESLRIFSSKLPKNVKQMGKYIEIKQK